MRTRKLGNSDLQITPIGLGTWAMGGGNWKFGWGPQDERQAVEAIVRAVDLGINWVDTAAVYGGGRSEELVGLALERLGPARRPLVATKCGRVMLDENTIVARLKRGSIEQECDASLRRLGVDTIDLYQIHWPDPIEDIEEGWSTLVSLVKKGKVRYIGVSNHNVEQMKRLEAIHPITSLQPPYSMIARDIETEILPFCQEQNIGVIVYSPMGKGLLTGTFDLQRATSLPASDHRSRDPRFQHPQLEINLELVDGLREIAHRERRSVAELSIAWVLRRPEVTAAIVGARRPDQIEGTVAAGDWRLSDATVEQIAELLDRHQQELAAQGSTRQARV